MHKLYLFNILILAAYYIFILFIKPYPSGDYLFGRGTIDFMFSLIVHASLLLFSALVSLVIEKKYFLHLIGTALVVFLTGCLLFYIGFAR